MTLNQFFQIDARQSTVAREVRGGVTTFLTMAYILVVNPLILSAAGVPVTAAATSTALAAGLCSILMGLWANFPLGLASGMGINALLAFKLTAITGSWQTAMGLIVIDGIIVVLLVLAGLREAVLTAIPRDLRLAIGAGIGLFIALIGFEHGHLVIADPNTLVTHGNLRDHEAIITLIGLAVIGALMMWRVTGAILIGVTVCTVVAFPLGVAHWPTAFPKPDFSVMFAAHVGEALRWKYVPLILSLVLIDFFDTLGTATAVAEEGGLIEGRGRIPRVRQILLVDGFAASIGGWFGASSVTAYIESASGVAEGARTGLHSVVVGILFLLALFVVPLVGIIPDCATAPALILVGFLMMSHVAEIDFRDYEHAIPAFLTILLIPLTFDISRGIGFGLIAQVVLSVLHGRASQVHPLLYIVAAAFAAYFIAGY